MKKLNKKLSGAIILGIIMAVPVGVSAAEAIGSIDASLTRTDPVIITSDKKVSFTNGKSAAFGIFARSGTDVQLAGNNVTVNSSTGTFNENRAVWAGADGKIALGNDNASVLINSVGADAMGMTAIGAGSSLTVKGKELIVNVDSDFGFGVHVQNNTQKETAPENAAKISIEAENIKINSKELGLSAFSNGQMDIKGNLTVNAVNALDVRGNSTVNINTDGAHSIVLNGNIVFETPNSPGNAQNSGNIINARLNINFSGADSAFNGRIYQSYKGSSGEAVDSVELNTPPYYGNVTGMEVKFADNAVWNMTGDSFVNTVALDKGGKINVQADVKNFNIDKAVLADGVIAMQGTGQKVNVNKLDGKGVISTVSLDNKMQISALDSSADLVVNGSGSIADQILQDKSKAQLLAETVVGDNRKTAVKKITADEGIIAGRLSADVNTDGKVDLSTAAYEQNTSNAAIRNMASVNMMTWRAENNDMNKRLGELRDSKGEHGAWARMVRGEVEYGAQSVKNRYKYYQVGYDEKLSTNPEWTVGVALSRTEGSTSFDGGSGENNHTGVAVYGSYLKNDGSFVDLIAKYARMDNKFAAAGGVGSGDYGTNGYSISAEYGKRFKQDNGFWIEPQVELTYGAVGAADYSTGKGAQVRQDGMDSIVARLGFSLGRDIKAGNIYARASYLYDFDSETKVTMSHNGVSDRYSQDLGGGWWEVGVGTNINLSAATHMYFDVEKTYGGDVATPWQWSAGVRYSF